MPRKTDQERHARIDEFYADETSLTEVGITAGELRLLWGAYCVAMAYCGLDDHVKRSGDWIKKVARVHNIKLDHEY